MTKQEKHRFYHSAEWLKKSKEIMRRDHYECQECRKRIELAAREGMKLVPMDRKIRAASQVHHIRFLDDAPELALVDDNLEAVCDRCHNLIHGRTPKQWTRKRKKKPATEERW